MIVLRRRFIGDQGRRYHLLPCSVHEEARLDAVKVYSPRPLLFLAETVFVYFTEVEVNALASVIKSIPYGWSDARSVSSA